MTTPAEARIQVSLSIPEAAKRLRIGTAYLGRLERTGGWPYVLAERAARLYDCRIETFLVLHRPHQPNQRTRKGDETTH